MNYNESESLKNTVKDEKALKPETNNILKKFALKNYHKTESTKKWLISAIKKLHWYDILAGKACELLFVAFLAAKVTNAFSSSHYFHSPWIYLVASILFGFVPLYSLFIKK